jgi:hypothetical protein
LISRHSPASGFRGRGSRLSDDSGNRQFGRESVLEADPAQAEARRVPIDCRTAINYFLAETNADPKHFVWTATARQEDRKALSFAGLIDLYLSEGVGHKKASALKADRGRIDYHLRPLLGKLRADRIVRADVERMRNAVTAGKTAEKRIVNLSPYERR